MQSVQMLPTNLVTVFPGQTPNWDLMVDMLNLLSTSNRSEQKVRAHYESVIVPREEGKITYDIAPKKLPQKGKKGMLKVNQVLKRPNCFGFVLFGLVEY